MPVTLMIRDEPTAGDVYGEVRAFVAIQCGRMFLILSGRSSFWDNRGRPELPVAG